MKARAINERKFLVLGEMFLATKRLIKKPLIFFDDCMYLVNTCNTIVIQCSDME